MKAIKIFSVMLFSFILGNIAAQTKAVVTKETIKVWGNCGMCKKKIEKAAKAAGASTASWNEDTKDLKVTYNSSKSSSQKIQQAIANVGYDTRDITGDSKAYLKLDECCKYDRKAVPAQ